MALSADTLLDRLALKRQVTRWRVLSLFAIVLALLIVSAGAQHSGGNLSAVPTASYIARLTIDDVVTDDRKRDELITRLRKDSHVKAVVVWLDTPGGSAVGGMETYKQLRAISVSGKPVVAVMRDLSASAGYLIAIGCDRIFAREATLTGSIGVIIEAAEFSTLAEKIGVTPITIKTGPLKDALSPFNKATPEAREAMQSVVDDFFRVFVDTVAERRGLPREEVLKLADGRVYTGNQAVQNKLVDAIGSEDDAIAWLVQEKHIAADLPIKDVKVKQDKLSWVDKFTDSMIQKIMPQASARLDGLVAIWHPSLQLQ